jgi:FlaA1/EpsC-like NDP-sugar epimerase
VISPVLALYLRDADLVFRGDWNVLGYYWLFSSGFALVAFVALRLQDGMTRYFSVHGALDIAEAALFTELMTFVSLFTVTRLEGIPRSMPLTHGLLLAGGLIAARIVVRVIFSEEKEPLDYHYRRERIGVNGSGSSPGKRNGQYRQRTKPAIAEVPARASLKGKPPDASIQNDSGLPLSRMSCVSTPICFPDALTIPTCALAFRKI